MTYATLPKVAADVVHMIGRNFNSHPKCAQAIGVTDLPVYCGAEDLEPGTLNLERCFRDQNI
jgi:hypothetical protein